MEKKDEISLVMLINKLQTAEDIENFRRLPGSEIEAILRDSPGRSLMDKKNMTHEEALKKTGQYWKDDSES